ncbi:MAG: hypothetical protein ACRDGI_09465 [Candidatus Limnocylindrales bacterium]
MAKVLVSRPDELLEAIDAMLDELLEAIDARADRRGTTRSALRLS